MIPTDNLLLYILSGAVVMILLITIRRRRNPPGSPPNPFKDIPSTQALTSPIKTARQPDKPVEAITAPNPPTIDISPPISLLQAELPKPMTATELVERYGFYDHKLELTSYQYPAIDLLQQRTSNLDISPASLEACKQKIVSTLKLYQVSVEKIKASIGPTVTLYEVTPGPGIRIARVKSLENDIAMSLAASGTRVTGQIPGTGAIGIEVPHQTPDTVSLRPLISTEKFQSSPMELPVILGKTMAGEVYIADLAKMPHLLIAGATGQGKSVCISAMLISLLYQKHPAELKLVLIDLNKLELNLFKNIERHFLAKVPDQQDAVISSLSQVSETLYSLSIEMDERYDLLKDTRVRSLREYNEKYKNREISDPERHRYLPYILVVVDEIADLVTSSDQTIETLITRVAQLGRPVGIHLVIATQRPSVNIITGTIKANFPCRIAFRVSSVIDSKAILDNTGAENLKGRGDMLFSNGAETVHLQGALVNSEEISGVCNFIGTQRGYPTALLLPQYRQPEWIAPVKEYDPDDRDPMFEEAARLVVLHQQGSTSLIQRKMKLGYNRAGRIMDQLEATGIVGAFEGSKARDVLYPDEYSLERYLEKLAKPRS